MSDWDDLFAAAAGENDGDTTTKKTKSSANDNDVRLGERVDHGSLPAPSISPTSSSSRKKKRRRKGNYDDNHIGLGEGKRRNITNVNKLQSSLFQAFLESRMDSIEEKEKHEVQQSTTDITTKTVTFPHWLCLGPSLCKKQGSVYFCPGYKNAATKRTSSSTSTDDDRCSHCSLSPLYHSCESTNSTDFLVSLSLIRNIRCSCSCIFEIMSPSPKKIHEHHHHQQQPKQQHCLDELKNACFEYTKTSKREGRKLQLLLLDKSAYYEAYGDEGKSLFHTLPLGEKDILENKVKNVVHAIEKLYSSMKKWRKRSNDDQQIERKEKNKKNDMKSNLTNHKECDDMSSFIFDDIFDELVRVIISLDAAYYRLYYLQVAKYFPILGCDKNNMAHIPHPSSYFGVENLTWNVSRGKEWRRDISSLVWHRTFKKDSNDNDNKLSSETWKHVLEPLGLVRSEDIDSIVMREEIYVKGKKIDPLSLLHQNRFMEGLLIFWSSKWIESDQAYKQLLKVGSKEDNTKFKKMSPMDRFYEEHETLAPPILAEWRDSCRDFLCNLYGYAALHPSTIEMFCKELYSSFNNIQRIIEMGSGTGYLANLLNQKGIKVDAFDIAPTTASTDKNISVEVNEYHGCTSPFYDVKRGNAKHLKSIFKQNKNIAPTTALLLCYPPPQTTMAEDMLNIFKSFGGRYVIHVGEFSGLTGSLKFQNTLKRDFEMIRRLDCLRWGTDSTELTIWHANKTMVPQRTLFLPCSNCQSKEALKQCRLLRSLRYCCVECFKQHKVERSIQLALHNIPLFSSNGRQNYLSYKNSNHFKDLF